MAPIYDYQAYAPDGKQQKGSVEAESPKAARLRLKKAGFVVTSITEKTLTRPTAKGGIPFFSGRVSQSDISLMTRQLASLVKANIPLVEALTALIDQTESEKLKVILSQVRQDVNEGSSLAKALSNHPRVFDNIYFNMVEAGESSGTLRLILLRLADLKEAQLRLRNKVTSEMFYPVLMLGVALILIVVIFTFVIPKLVKIFESTDKPIPMTTQVLIFFSDQLASNWFFYVIGIAVSIAFFFRYINSKQGRPKWDAFKLRAPVFGNLVRMLAVTRFTRTMATLLKSGVPILTAMKIANNLVGNVLIAEAVERARENITEGQSIAEPLKRSGQFPPLVTHMIGIGEKTGELADMLGNVADTYEEQIGAKIQGLTGLLGPIMIIGMAVGVAFIIISVFIPLMEISNIQ